jgi:hypothetical protein
LKTFKEKDMVKVSVVMPDRGFVEYEGIIVNVSADQIILLPFDSDLRNACGLYLKLSDITKSSAVRFPKEIADLLKDLYVCHRKMLLAGEIMIRLESEIAESRKIYFQSQKEIKDKTEILIAKRFEHVGSSQDIASKLFQDIKQKELLVLYESFSERSIHMQSIKAEGKVIFMNISFEKMVLGDNLKELYWMDYEKQFDCSDWDAIKEKHCPSMSPYLKEVFPFATMVSEEKTYGNSGEKRRVQLDTNYKLSFTVSKVTYSEVLRMLVQGLLRFKHLYVKGDLK